MIITEEPFYPLSEDYFTQLEAIATEVYARNLVPVKQDLDHEELAEWAVQASTYLVCSLNKYERWALTEGHCMHLREEILDRFKEGETSELPPEIAIHDHYSRYDLSRLTLAQLTHDRYGNEFGHLTLDQLIDLRDYLTEEKREYDENE